MVEILFEDVAVPWIEDILYPACGTGRTIAAVERYCGSNSSDPPSGVALDPDPENVRSVADEFGDHVDAKRGRFLSPNLQLGSFDLVLCCPPTIRWASLDSETRREYATALASLSLETEAFDVGASFLEKSATLLNEDGRGVFLVPNTLKTSDIATEIRAYVASEVTDVIPAPSDSSEDRRMITTISSSRSDPFQEAPTSTRPDPGVVERELLRTPDEYEQSLTAGGIATPVERMDVYDATDDAAFVYLDMFYEDYDASLVYEDSAANDGLRGYVERATMRVERNRPVAEHVHPLDESVCLRPSTALGEVVQALADEGERFRFVGRPENLHGIVTRYDLNSLPVYQSLYDYLARFELQLRELVRSEAPHWESRTSVSVPAGNTGPLAPDDLAGASLRDLLEIVNKTGIESELPYDPAAHDITLGDLRKLRNSVAHYNPLVVSMNNDSDVEKTADRLGAQVELLETLSTQAGSTRD